MRSSEGMMDGFWVQNKLFASAMMPAPITKHSKATTTKSHCSRRS
jgi:hypothetical protein